MGSSPAARHAEGLGGADQRSDGLSHEESPTFQTLGSERLVYPPTSASNHDRPAESRGADHRRVSPSCSPPMIPVISLRNIHSSQRTVQ